MSLKRTSILSSSVIVVALVIFSITAAGQTVINVLDVFYPTGLMGDWGDISIRDDWTGTYHSAPFSFQIKYTGEGSSGQSWAGIYWQYPKYNWGDKPGLDLSRANRLTFWARGENGREKAEFRVGGIVDGTYKDSVNPPLSLGTIELESAWRRYEIPLEEKNLNQVIGGFCWLTFRRDNPNGCTIYLDDIRYET